MKIKSLKIINPDEKEFSYFFDDNTMIYSKENSKGKTTLIRFILHSLGYQIPATEGIGDFKNYITSININNNKGTFFVFRKDNSVQLQYNDKTINYSLPEQENDLHSFIFEIDNITVLNNLLAVYYIDQEKGWTLLNRGKIIGNIRFNIEEFIAGVSNKNISGLLDEKKVINNEIKKYRYFKNVIDINSEFSDDDDIDYSKFENLNMDELLSNQKILEVELKKIRMEKKQLESIIKKNNGFAEMIENYGLVIKHKDDEFILTKDKLLNFDRSQDILKIKLNNYKIEELKLNNKLEILTEKINNKNSLFEMDDLINSMQHIIEKNNFDINQIDKIIRQLTNKRNNLNSKIKDVLSFNNQQLYEFYEIIVKYATELGIVQYISDMSPRYVLTNKLKGLSGRVLSQMSYVFKLSYIKTIENTYGIILPIIIDSPRTNELSEKSSDDMLKILKRDFSYYQIIVASIYESDIINFNIIDLKNGFMS